MQRNGRRPSALRRATGWVLTLMLTLGYFAPGQQALRTMPDTLHLTAGQWQELRLGHLLTLTTQQGAAAVSASEDETLRQQGGVSVQCDAAGVSELMLSLLGIIPLKKVEVQVSPEKKLIPGGMAIGVALHTSGVLVVGTSDLSGGEAGPARVGGILPGDLIRKVRDVDLTSSAQFSLLVAEAGEEALPLTLERNGETLHVTVTPRMDATTGTARLGMWVRDSTAGVGTLSFYDPDNGTYAALGHAITDGDTGQVLTVEQGQILKAEVVSVQKGQKGVPGELKGSFLREGVVLGDITRNNMLGIYGHLDTAPVNSLYPEGLPIGLRSGVHTGPATILSTVDGEGIKEYAVEITRVNPQTAPAPKSMVLRVTDPELLAKTGGIVQGMSGSPILQDGRIIGAVTHVFVGNPEQGYGLYIDWMLGE